MEPNDLMDPNDSDNASPEEKVEFPPSKIDAVESLVGKKTLVTASSSNSVIKGHPSYISNNICNKLDEREELLSSNGLKLKIEEKLVSSIEIFFSKL